MKTLSCPFAIGLLCILSSHARAMSVTIQIAYEGSPYGCEKDDLPEGTAALVNHRLRGIGWSSIWTGHANDLSQFQLKVRDAKELQDLVDLLARVKTTTRCIVLKPAEEPIVRTGRRPGLAKGNGTAVVFSIGCQRTIDTWYERLPEEEPGVRKFGVRRYREPPTAQPPTLTLYVANDAVDLTQIEVSPDVEVRASFDDAYREKRKEDSLIRDIDRFVAKHKAKREAASRKPKESRAQQPADRTATPRSTGRSWLSQEKE